MLLSLDTRNAHHSTGVWWDAFHLFNNGLLYMQESLLGWGKQKLYGVEPTYSVHACFSWLEKEHFDCGEGESYE